MGYELYTCYKIYIHKIIMTKKKKCKDTYTDITLSLNETSLFPCYNLHQLTASNPYSDKFKGKLILQTSLMVAID